MSFVELGLQSGWVSQKLQTRLPASSSDLKIFKKDPLCGYVLNPLDTTQGVTINSHGLRGKDFDDTKPKDIIRILCMGSYFTFGYMSGDRETYPFLLEKELQKIYKGKKIQVINAGIPGFSSTNNFFFFTNYLSKLKPDIVLYEQSRYNSPLMFISDNSFFMNSEKKLFRNLSRFFARMDMWVQKRSILYSFVKVNILKCERKEEDIWENINRQLDAIESREKEPERKESFLQHVDANVKYMKKLGITPVLLETHWRAFSIKKDYQSGDIIQRIGDSNSVAVIRSKKAFRKRVNLFQDPLHLNKDGNLAFAKMLASDIHKLNLPILSSNKTPAAPTLSSKNLEPSLSKTVQSKTTLQN